MQQNRSLPASLCKQQACPGTRGVWVNQGAPEALPAVPTYPPLAEPASHLRISGPQWPEYSSAQDSLADPAQGRMALLHSCSPCCVGGPHSLPDTSEHRWTLHSPHKASWPSLWPWKALPLLGPLPRRPSPGWPSRLLADSRTSVRPWAAPGARCLCLLPPPPLGWPPQQTRAHSGPLPWDPTAPGPPLTALPALEGRCLLPPQAGNLWMSTSVPCSAPRFPRLWTATEAHEIEDSRSKADPAQAPRLSSPRGLCSQ